MHVSHLSYEEEKVEIKPAQNYYDVKLKLKVNTFDDVVVTGIFDRPKESFTGSATKFTKQDIKMAGNRNLLKTLGNLDPSFDILEMNDFGSDPNQIPDIEIRGTTTISSVNDLRNSVRNRNGMNLPLFILDGFEVSIQRVMDMNQVDVESVTILKDASAKALYGSRGANGVVVITSSIPAPGTLRINYSGGLNLELPDVSTYNLLSAAEKFDLEVRSGYYKMNDPVSKAQYDLNSAAVARGVNTDWKGMPVQTGIGQYHKLDITGGDQKFRYIIDASYNQIKGAMKGSERNNFNGGITFNYIGNRFQLSNITTIGFNNAANSPYGVYDEYVKLNPYWEPFDENGNLVKTFPLGTQYKRNPLLAVHTTDFSTDQYHNIRNSTNFNWEIINGLRWSSNIGFSYQAGENDLYQSPNSTNEFDKTSIEEKGWYTKGNNKRQNYQFGSSLTYGKVLGRHNLYFGLNTQVIETKTFNSTVIAKGFLNDQMTDISQALSYAQDRPNTRETTVRTIGLSGMANYNYDNRYYTEFSYRRDAASSFGNQSRWAPFWSLGLGWTASNEEFFAKNLKFINVMRLRYSYGVTGSMNFQPYDAMTIYQYQLSNNDFYRNIRPLTVQTFGNPDLQWQNTKEHNFGLELQTLNNRLNIVANYYYKNTTNLVSDANLRYSNGFASYKANIGTIRNTGYDLMATYVFWKDKARDMNWAITSGLYHNDNVLVKLSSAIKEANALLEGQNLSFNSIPEYREGKSVNTIYVLNSPGVDIMTGEVLYKNSKGQISTGLAGIGDMDKIAVGSSVPKIHGRLGTNLHWKGLNVAVNFAIRLGGKKLNQTLLNRVENGYIRDNLDRRVLDHRWIQPGDNTGYRGILSTDYTQANNRFVFTENTVTLNNVNIFYDCPTNLINKMGLQRLTIGATMSDIFYWSNIQMERGTQYPYSLKPTFTLNATF
ncbi:SusC/RagA family TonB-linked outer membrane protein [Sphingobacterium sp. DR205]|uniref:SusC/RagA family TonB-linked outer membrane protein n=1 Tax=Sphingobacterium sp. DR205 TaxID=2713573 RepID=UPI0013E51A49|nr:SusC/RagA family TonB-linked outer membrane protein [Sphingobacterium sp. DR205]QIH35915.1 SusC/RagA family TonB-linked outer membrane protein [Sphingobacterium sp. DR205]